MTLIAPPQKQDQFGTVKKGGVQLQKWWSDWFVSAYNILFAVTQSGTTAQRPTKLLWLGRTYYDTDLGIPIWVSQVTPSVVWTDATGSPV